MLWSSEWEEREKYRTVSPSVLLSLSVWCCNNNQCKCISVILLYNVSLCIFLKNYQCQRKRAILSVAFFKLKLSPAIKLQLITTLICNEMLLLWMRSNFNPLFDWNKINFSLNKTDNVRINVLLRCVRETTVAVQKQQVLHISVCVCV